MEENENTMPFSKTEKEVTLSSMTIAQLKTLAEERDVDLGKAKTKAEIIQRLES